MQALIAVVFILWVLDFVFTFIDNHFLIFATPFLIAGGVVLFLALVAASAMLAKTVVEVIRSANGKTFARTGFMAVFALTCAYYANDWISAPYGFYRDIVAGTLAKRTDFMKAEGDAAYHAVREKASRS